MSDKSEHDDLDGFQDPEVLKLIVRGEREDHKRELETMRQEFEQRLAGLQKKVERGETPRPDIIHPDDVTDILTHGKQNSDAIYARLRDGSLKVSEDAPKGAWKKPQERIGVIQLLRLPLSEYEKVMARVEKGEVEVVGEE